MEEVIFKPYPGEEPKPNDNKNISVECLLLIRRIEPDNGVLKYSSPEYALGVFFLELPKPSRRMVCEQVERT